MGVPQKALAYIQPEEYLALEEKSAAKHEYLDGAIYAWQGYGPQAMAGGSKEHNQICGNLYVALRAVLRGSPCRAYMTDVRLHVEAANAFFYPDLAVTCAEADRSNVGADRLQIREPVLIVEVLSDSTETFDRGEKFDACRRIASLREYVLVPQRGRPTEIFRRGPTGWDRQFISSGELDLQSVGARISLEAIYEDL
jgi:Uma2 family endonuclease